MKLKAALLALILCGLFSCSKVFKLTRPAVQGEEIVARYKSLARPPISAALSATSSLGSFKGQMYLESGSPSQGLIYGFTPFGQSLFELKMEGGGFLFLDLASSRAYSNRKQWLGNYVTGPAPEAQDRLVIYLADALGALMGGIKEPLEFSRDLQGRLLAAAGQGQGYAVKYYFDPSTARLSRLDLKKDGENWTFKFSYGPACWFPGQIRLQGQSINAGVNLSDVVCPEHQKPKMDWTAPEGFLRILLTAP